MNSPGELALTGELRPIRGALAMTYNAHRSGRAFVLPVESATEAALVRDARVYPAATLLQVCAHLAGRKISGARRRPAAVADTGRSRTLRTSRARHRPNEHSKLPPPAATAC